jgi:serine protease
MWTWALLTSAPCNTASAGILTIRPDAPPVAFRSEDGRLYLRFPDLSEPIRTDEAVLVTLRAGARAPDELRRTGRPLGASARHWVVPAGGDVVAEALRWAADAAVLDAIPDVWLEKRTAAFDDPDYGAQWYLDTLGMEALYAETLGDAAIRVAVLDSGIDIAHPDLAAGLLAPLDVVDGDDDPSPVPGEDCPAGDETSICDNHGTSVSGIVGARANNGTNIVGMCPECSLIPIRMIGGPASNDVEAFEHALDNGAAVLNNSWGYASAIPTPVALAEVIARVAAEGNGGQGSVIVFAAGNDDRKLDRDELTNEPGVFCVSATDRYHLPTAYTNRGAAVDVAAPSATVTLAPGGGLYTTFGGTSAAAPVVAGLAGWLLSYDPSLTATEATDLIVATATKNPTVTFDEDGHHEIYGYGEIDPPAMLARLRGDGLDSAADARGPKGCGCASAPGPALAPLAGLALGLLARRRRA